MEIIRKMNANDNSEVQKHWLPLYSGELACGLFGIADDFVESYLSLDEKFLKNKESTFFVRASGDSMSPEIKGGDILIVDRSLNPIDGSIVAVFFNGNPICKQLRIQGEHKFLHAFNKDYPDLEITEDDELQVFGVVIGLARDLY